MEDPTKFWNTIFKPKYDTNRLKINTTRTKPEELPGKVTIISKDSELAIPKAMGHSHKGNTYIYKEYMDVIDPEETIIHEAAHNFRDTNPDNIALISNRLKLSDLYAPDAKFYLLEEMNTLDEAYSFVPGGYFSDKLKTLSALIAEKASTNTLLQYAIWKLSGAKNISELNTAIDKLSDDDILYMLQLTNGYGNDFVNYIASNPNTKSQAVSNIRKALKYVPVMTGVTGYGGYKLYENLNKQ